MRELALSQASTGARVSNTYPTCLFPGNNLAKVRLMPYVSSDGIRRGRKIYRKRMGMRLIRQLAGQRPTKPTIGSRTERLIGHIGTETRPRLLREAAVGNIGQWAKA